MGLEGPSVKLTSGGKSDFIHEFDKKCKSWIEEQKQDEVGRKEKADRVETESTLPGHDIYGFKNEIKSMKNFLLDQKVRKEFKSLVIVGEYGVGKTALCKTIFNHNDVKSVYAPRIWVSMHSKETKAGEDKRISVLKRILKEFGVKDEMFKSIHDEARQEASAKTERRETGVTTDTEELSALLYALHLNLRWKKYLIVFDDVREADNWNQILEDDEEKLKKDKSWGRYLSDGFPKGSGGRVIYTTREETLAKKLVAEEHEIHRLWPLTDSKSVWDIYEAVVKKKKKEVPRNDKKCIDELMNKSRGLPLAARLIAKLEPVFLDSETVLPNDTTPGTTAPANHPTSEEGRTTQPPQA